MLRTVALLPFLEQAALSAAAGQLFGDPAVLLRSGWSPLQIRIADNERHRSPAGRRAEPLPCSPETLRDAMARVERQAWQRAQESGVKALFEHGLVRGRSNTAWCADGCWPSTGSAWARTGGWSVSSASRRRPGGDLRRPMLRRPTTGRARRHPRRPRPPILRPTPAARPP